MFVYTRTHMIFMFLSTVAYRKVLGIAPCALQRGLVVCPSCLRPLIPNSHSTRLPLATVSLFSLCASVYFS